jgi:hypothetical protein
LISLALVALLAAGFAWTHDRGWPALLAVGVGALSLFAWRMSGDLDPVGLSITGGWLTIQTRRHLVRREILGAGARRLEAAEIEHLRRLTAAGGFVTASGGFESHLLGEIDVYCSDLANAVLLDVGGEHLVVTPDDPDAFLVTVQELPGAAATIAHP